MKLEDFFTLTEMNNGLTTPARIQELISVMQENNSDVKSLGDAARQWSAIANTIAATESKDCLELFIQLDGLSLIDGWLRDAQKFGGDLSDNFIQESITHVLQAIEKLQIDKEKSVSSGIWTSVEKLLGHKCSKVQDRAKAIFDTWEKDGNNIVVSLKVEKLQMSVDGGTGVIANVKGENGRSGYSTVNAPHSKGGCADRRGKQIGDGLMPSLRSDALHPDRVCDEQKPDITLGNTKMQEGPSHQANSLPLDEPDICHNGVQTTPRCHSEGTSSMESCTSAGPKHGILGEQYGIPNLVSRDDSKHMQENRSSEKFDSVVSKPSDEAITYPSANPKDALDSVTEPDLQKCTDAKDKGCSLRTASFNDATAVVNDQMSVMGECGSASCCNNVEVSEDSNKHNLENANNFVISLTREENNGEGHEVDKDASDESHDLQNDLDFMKMYMHNKDANGIGKKSDIDFDYGTIDPLDVTRRVAIEVEREGEHGCSSSEKLIAKSKVHEPDRPDSVDSNKDMLGEIHPYVASSMTGEKPSISVGNSDAAAINGTEDRDSSQVSAAVSDVEVDSEKGVSGFDLNQDVCSKDIDHPGEPFSTHVSVVSTKRTVEASGLQVAPSQFGGTFGCKGSAATSTCHPASTCQIPEGDKAVSTAKHNCLDIDLNIAGAEDDRSVDLIAGEQVPSSSALPSGESSAGSSLKKLERLELDLNRVTDEGGAPSNWSMVRQLSFQDNGECSQSSSLSTSKQTLLRNIDLNDQPSFLNDSSDVPYLIRSPWNLTSGAVKSGECVVSVMGIKLEADRKDVTQSMHLTNGRILETSLDVNKGVLGMRSPLPYAHSPAHNYNGITPGPAMPLSSAIYGTGGPIPCTFGTSAAHVPIVGSASSLPPSFLQQPNVFSLTRYPLTNGVMPSQSSFDLNSCTRPEVGNRDFGDLRHFFNPLQPSSMDERLKSNAQPSTNLSVGVKRKEPDGGWEPFAFKHNQPPWN